MTDCPPHPPDSVEEIADEFYICSECNQEFDGEYDQEVDGYVELQKPE